MMESPTQPEVLTFAPGERDYDRWLQRTVSNAGEQLGSVRDRVLDAALLQRHHAVLDLNAGSGLLTWEILRRTPEGGTWALARDRQAGGGLRQQAERLPEMERPTVLVGELEELPELLALRGESELRFDAIVGRNALGSRPNKVDTLRLLAAWLQPGGCLSLAETVVRRAQRLYGLVDLSPLGESLPQRLVEAEEQIYADPGDPLVNWEAATLREAFESAGFAEVSVSELVQESELLVSQATLLRWFSTDVSEGRPSYAQHLLRQLSSDELAGVRALFQRQLAGETVPWSTCLAFVVARM
jgi:putative ATPase